MSRSFPWALFRRFLTIQILVFVPILLLVSYGLEVQFLAVFSLAILFVLAQAVIGIRTYLPMARLLDNPQQNFDEPDEWFDIQALIKRHQFQNSKTPLQDEIFRATLEVLQEAVLIIDQNKNVQYWNSSLSELSQIKELYGLHLEEVFRDPDILSIFGAALTSGEKCQQNFPIRLPGSATRYISLLVVPIKPGAIGVFTDFTNLQRSQNMRSDFVANVSHELRTPLTSLKGYAQAIEAESKDQNITEYSRIISRNVDRLINLVNDLLDLSYLESGVRLEINHPNVREVTESVLHQLEEARARKNIVINLNIGVEKVRADRMRLEQVLTNLVDNSIKYIPENSTIDVEWAKENEDVLLKVRDNGPGIDDQHLPRLFERFYRADRARSPGKGGTGLGLAIVKHIMQRHGGQVSVNSQAGKGTEFICRFPA